SRDRARTWRMSGLHDGPVACSEAPGALSNSAGGQDPPCVRYGGAHPDSQGSGMDRRQFIGSAALAALLPLAGGGRALAAPRRRLLPAPLGPGDTIALVSPSSAT